MRLSLQAVVTVMVCAIGSEAIAGEAGSREEPIMIDTADHALVPKGGWPAVFPPRALIEEKPGAATIVCRVTEEGRLTACFVRSETPKGYGFGKAAVELGRHFRMNATRVDGTSLSGKWISLTQKFSLE